MCVCVLLFFSGGCGRAGVLFFEGFGVLVFLFSIGHRHAICGGFPCFFVSKGNQQENQQGAPPKKTPTPTHHMVLEFKPILSVSTV